MNAKSYEQEILDRISDLSDQAWEYQDKYGYPNRRLEDQIADEQFSLRQLRQVKEIFNK